MMAVLKPNLRGELRYDVPLKSMTAWRVGGNAQRLFRPYDLEDLCHFLSHLPKREPLMWLGLGSNLLVRDAGVRGTVIAMYGALSELTKINHCILRAQAGVPCAKVARFAAKQGLTGTEFLASIPGTMGGALAMNAGAFGGETWQWVEAVETVGRNGRIHRRGPEEFRASYRHVILPADEWFVAVQLRLMPGDSQTSLQRIRSLLARRSESQPTGVASCGSVFRNPPGDFAARLIDTADLKGRVIGGAKVSEKHANFIINTGKATAADIEALIIAVRRRVEKVHGIKLKPEVQIVGEAS
ncbi:MAG: UDP-N-acetylmuramate dehydrogenase [Gammaproteobacteria bacterium]|nr:UDP-N-acetylmuramate dehydrogenase [Gammaproteobacteria bacterium]